MSTFATLEASALADEIRVVAFRGTERLCRPYQLEIFAQVEGHGGGADLGDAIASKATLQLHRDQDLPQRFHGILANVSLLQQTPTWALYRVLLVPRLWQLGLTRHSRVFTKQSLPEIIKVVLEEAGFGAEDFELKLDGQFPVEEHVVQYQESLLAFLHRWMEREGMYYFFEQGESAEKLLIVDHGSFHQTMVENKSVRYFPLVGHDTSAGECFDAFAAIRSATVGAVRLGDYDYARPQLDLSANQQVSDRGFGEVRMHAGRFFDPEQAKRYARIRGEALKAAEVIYHAAGTALHMSAGYQVALTDHPGEPFNTKYLLTEVHHFCNQLQQEEESHLQRIVKPEFKDVYRVETKAVDASQPYRAPQATPWPRVQSYEAGVVDGPTDSEYAQIDEQGRYLVKLGFDESSLEHGKASTYVRMMQPHGGTTEGWHFPLRKGTEVIIAFLGGDPDRPIIAGVVPNAQTPSPVTSDNQTWNIIQTGGSNRLRINDQKGEEYIDISTPYNKSILAMGFPTSLKGFGEPPHDVEASIFFATQGTAAFFFGGDWEIEVTGDKKELIGGNVSEEYETNHRSHVIGNFDHIINGRQSTIVSLTRLDSVKGAVTELYKTSLDTTVTGPHSHTVTGTQNVVVTGAQEVQTGDRTDKILGTLSQTATGPVSIGCPEMTITAAGGYKVVAPQSWWMGLSGSFRVAGGAAIDVFGGLKLGVMGGGSASVNVGGKMALDLAVSLNVAMGPRFDFTSATNTRIAPVVTENAVSWLRTGANTMIVSLTTINGILTVV